MAFVRNPSRLPPGSAPCRPVPRRAQRWFSGVSLLSLLATVTPAWAEEITLDGGTTTVTGTGTGDYPSPWIIDGNLTVGTTRATQLKIGNGGIVTNGTMTVGTGPGWGESGRFTTTIDVSGSGSRLSNTLFLVGDSSDTFLSIRDGATVETGWQAYMAGKLKSTSTVNVFGAGSEWRVGSVLDVGGYGRASLNIWGGGLVRSSLVSIGSGFDGWNLGTGRVELSGDETSRGVLEAITIYNGGGNASFVFNGGVLRAIQPTTSFLQGSIEPVIQDGGAFVDTNGFDVTISASLRGWGDLTKQGRGTLTLSGTNYYSGATHVEAGTLFLTGSYGDFDLATTPARVNVLSGAAFGGTGTLDGSAILADGASLTARSGQSLTINRDLTLSPGSFIDLTLNRATDTPFFKVADSLTLAGTINVSTFSELNLISPGIYRLFSYGGTLFNYGLAVGSVPAGIDPASFRVQTSVNGEINLIYTTLGEGYSFWDGADPAYYDNNRLEGGSGIWSANGAGWADQNGTTNTRFADQDVAVFQGTAGTVRVANSAGAVIAGGMQFAVNGYRLEGDPITLGGDGPVAIGVGNGMGGGTFFTATIASALSGNAGLKKTDLGTLVLTGANTYTGGTTIEAGTLRLDGAGTLGSTQGALSLERNGRLDLYASTQYAGSLSGAGTITSDNSSSSLLGILNVDQSVDGTFSGRVIAGANRVLLNKTGSSTLTMTGASEFQSLSVNGGKVVLSGAAASLQARNGINAGNSGAGTFLAEKGANATAEELQIAMGNSGAGTLIIRDSGTSVSTRTSIVGLLAEGNLRVEAGGRLNSSGNTFLGANGGYLGRAVVTGAGARWTSDGNLYVGHSGQGELIVEEGGLLDAQLMTIGYNSGSSGRVVVRGVDGSRGILSAGLITVDSGARKLVFDGGILTPQADQSDFLRGFEPGEVEIAGGGLYYDDQGRSATISTDIEGSGSLVKRGTGTLTLTGYSRYSGGTIIEQGTVRLSGRRGGLSTGGGRLTIARGAVLELGGSNPVSVGSLLGEGTITNAAAATRRYIAVNQNGDTTFSGQIVNGAGEVDLMIFGSDTLTLTGTNRYRLTGADRGKLTIADGGMVTNDFAQANFGSVFKVTGTASRFDVDTLQIAEAGDGTLEIENGGTVNVANRLIVGSGSNTGASGIIALAGTEGRRGMLSTRSIVHGVGTARLLFDGGILSAAADEADLLQGFVAEDISIGSGGAFIDSNRFAVGIRTPFTGQGNITKLGSGTLTLNGNNLPGASYLGMLFIDSGTLAIDGYFGDPVANAARIHAGSSATLSGTGRVGGSVSIDSGGTLSAQVGQVLRVDGDLDFASGAIFSAGLGPAGNPALVEVGGDLLLDGRLDIRDAGGFGIGVHRLISYRGRLTDNGMNIGSVPVTAQVGAMSLQTSVSGTVNLVNASGLTLGFWDGGSPLSHNNGRIDGGSGLWSMNTALAGPNWTDQTAALNGGYNPNPTFAVFQGAAGTVTVDQSGGTVGVTGLQFAADGYRIEGDGLSLLGARGETVVRVGDGTAAGAQMVATIDTVLSGNSRLIKDDLGTLLLTSVNTYSGGTQLRDGAVRISTDQALGATSGTLIFSGGRLETTADLESSRPISMLGRTGGLFDVSGATTARFNGTISGTTLTKRGAGTLTLGGVNSYTGGTRIEAGTLRVLNDRALGSGSIRMAGGTTLSFAASPYSSLGPVELQGQVTFAVDAGQDAGLYRTISGSAGFEKTGAGTLSLYGDNSFSGDVRVREGELWLDNWRHAANQSLADDARLTVDAGALVAFQRSETFGALLGSGTADITYAGPDGISIGASGADFAFAGNLTGLAPIATGYGLQKIGRGTMTLTGTSDTNQSLLVKAGRLRVSGSIASRRVDVADTAVLDGSGSIAGLVHVADGGRLEGRSGQTLRLGGLSLSANALVSVSIGAPSDTALFDVAGDVTLDGRLDVADAGGFSTGIHRLISYGGILRDNGLVLGTIPAGSDRESLGIQTSVLGQVNLVSTRGQALTFWDGGDSRLHGNTRIDGGSGAWRQDGPNWTDSAGVRNGRYGASPAFAIFQGTGGTVQIDDDAGSISVTGLQFAVNGYRLTGDRLDLRGGRQTVIRVGDGTAAGATITASIDAALSGNTDLVKDDRGTLVLAGENTYSGDTLVIAGKIVGNTRSLKGRIFNAGNVVFDQSDDGTYAGQITGLGGSEGAMVKRGTGRLVLAGASTLDWTIEQGTVVSSANRFTGDLAIEAGGEFVFDQRTAGSFSGAIAGTGALSVSGGGRLLITGDATAFRGLTEVEDATLLLGSSLGGSARIGRAGRLGGSATIGTGAGSTVTIAAGGTIAPGYSPGIITVNGNLVIEADARYEVETGSASIGSDLIRVTGEARINGGTVIHVSTSGGFDPSTAYQILTADAGVTGRFAGVDTNLAFLDPSLIYAPTSVSLALARNGVAFSDVARTRNQKATAEALEGPGVSNRLQNAIVQLDATSARAAFDQLSGEIHASLATGLVDDGRFVRDAMNSRLRSASGRAAGRPLSALAFGPDGSITSASDDEFGPVFWSSGTASWSMDDSDGNAAALRRSMKGVLFGVDALAFDTWRIGVLGGYGQSSYRVEDRFSTARADSYYAGLYAGTTAGNLVLRSGLSYGWHQIETSRSISFAGLSERLDADYRASLLQAYGEIAYSLDFPDFRLEPFASLAHVRLASNGYAETGGIGALSGEDLSRNVSFATLGLRAEREIDLGGTPGRLSGSIGWRRAMGDTVPEVVNHFGGSDLFTIGGTPLARNSLLLEAGVNFELGPQSVLELSYTGQLSPSAREHGVKLELNIRF